MKKDYIVISPEQAEIDEHVFAEDLWTHRFANETLLPQRGKAVPQQQEYRIIQPFLAQLPSGSRILDGGCGEGEWVTFLTSQGFAAIGLDIREQTITQLKKSFPNCQFVCGDIRHTDFESNSFDAYFSWGTFEHFENGLEDCIGEAWRVLKPGGLLFVSVPFQNWWHILRDRKSLHKVDPTYDPQRGYQQPHRFYQWRLTRPELQRELELRGFRVLLVRPAPKWGGVSKWLRLNIPWLKQGSRLFALLRRAMAAVLPEAYISHSILAAAQKVG